MRDRCQPEVSSHRFRGQASQLGRWLKSCQSGIIWQPGSPMKGAWPSNLPSPMAQITSRGPHPQLSRTFLRHHLRQQINGRHQSAGWNPFSTIWSSSSIGPKDQQLIFEWRSGLTSFAWTQSNVCFHLAPDRCPEGICPRDSASLFLGWPKAFSVLISTVRSSWIQSNDQGSSRLLSSSRWHSEAPPRSTTTLLGLSVATIW